MTEVCSAGFPHSDICGSKDICSSPQLFAAYHVFHRLSVPRHPPCALISLIIKAIFSLSYYFRNEYIFDLNRRYCFLFVSMSFDIFTGCLFYLIKTLFDNVFTVCSFQGTKLTVITVSGDKGIRTLDPLLARQVLSQLSYTPINPASTYSPMPSPA